MALLRLIARFRKLYLSHPSQSLIAIVLVGRLSDARSYVITIPDGVTELVGATTGCYLHQIHHHSDNVMISGETLKDTIVNTGCCNNPDLFTVKHK